MATEMHMVDLRDEADDIIADDDEIRQVEKALLDRQACIVQVSIRSCTAGSTETVYRASEALLATMLRLVSDEVRQRRNEVNKRVEALTSEPVVIGWDL